MGVPVPILGDTWVIKSISYTDKNILEGFELPFGSLDGGCSVCEGSGVWLGANKKLGGGGLYGYTEGFWGIFVSHGN